MCDELRKRGFVVSPRQIERARDAGVVPRTIRKSLGRAKGTSSRYADDAADQIAEAFELKARYGAFDDVLCVLFYRGYDVAEAKLKRAWSRRIEHDLEFLRSIADADDTDYQIEANAQRARRQLSRSRRGQGWGRRLRGRGESSSAVLDGVISVLLRMLLGEPFSPEGAEELLDATAFSALRNEVFPGVGPMVPDLSSGGMEEAAKLIDPSEQLRVLRTMPYEELVATRDELQFIMDLLTQFQRFVSRVWETETAFGVSEVAALSERDIAYAIPTFAIAFRRMGDAVVQQWITELAPQPARYRAYNVVVDHLPEKYWSALQSEEALSRFSEIEMFELQREMDRIKSEHPEVTAALEE